MADNSLAILISARINEGLSINNINQSLKTLSKKVDSLNIKINIDQSVLTNLASLSKNLGNITQQINQQNIANNKNTQGINSQVKATNEAINAEKRLGIEKERTNSKGVNTSTYGNSKNNNKQIVTTLPDGAIQLSNTKNQLKDYQDAEKMDRDHFNAIKTNKKMKEDMEKVHYLALQKNREINLKSLEAEYKQAETLEKMRYENAKKNSDDVIKNNQQTQSAINSAFSGKQSANSASNGVTDVKALDLLNRKYSETIAKLNEAKNSGKQLTENELNGINRRITSLNNLATRQKQVEKERSALSSTQLRAEMQVANLTSKHGSNIDSSKLNSLLTQLKALDTTTSNYKGKSSQITQEINKMGNEAKNASQNVGTLGTKFKVTLSNMAMYAGIGSVFYGSINALKEMTRTIIEVDTQMTQLKRVMSEDTDFDGMLSNSIDLANELGRSIKEVTDNAIGFARMGFDENQTIELAKTATLFQNISELTPDEAVDTLTAAMTVFGVEAGKSIEVANKINEVNKISLLAQQCA